MPPFQLLIDPILLRKHADGGQRYESYPTCDFYVEAIGAADVEHWFAAPMGPHGRALSLYMHLPFCEATCRYAGCRKIVARPRERLQKYVGYLAREVALVSAAMGERRRRAARLHLRCAVADLVSSADFAGLMHAVRLGFEMGSGAEWLVDVQVRHLEPGRVSMLGALGFNELSILVQDFEGATRIRRTLDRCFSEASDSGFRASRIELAYGPGQTLDSFQSVLEHAIGLAPERIGLRGHRDREETEPEGGAMRVAALAAATLVNAGYLHIGLGNFVRAGSRLAAAKRLGGLQYGLEGYAELPECDVLGFGVSAIGSFGANYWQNVRDLDEYCGALEAGRLPVWRGLELSADDVVRRAVIHGLICNFRVSIEAIERAHLIDFRRYFAREMERLGLLADEGLVELTPEWIVVAPQGKLLTETVCAVFDRRLRSQRRTLHATL